VTLRIIEREGSVAFDVLVAPRAARERLGPVVGDRLKVAVTAPPVEGKANEAVVAALAHALGVKRHEVTIVTGDKGKRKTVQVSGLTRAELMRRLDGCA
jgi:uncharacterized protein